MSVKDPEIDGLFSLLIVTPRLSLILVTRIWYAMYAGGASTQQEMLRVCDGYKGTGRLTGL